MDPHAFASLVHLRILLLPVGAIQQSTFDKHAEEIRNFDEIRLSDIPADGKDERVRFMPKPLQAGHIHLRFPSHPPPEAHAPLSLFRPSHFPLGVIGVATCSQNASLSSILTQFNSSLLNVFPHGSMFPLAKNCFVFEDSDGNTSSNLGDNLPGLVVIPNIMGNKKIYVGTLLADLCSNILGEFGHVVHTLESPLGNEYLNSALFPILPPLSEMPQPLDNMTNMDSLPPLPSHNSQPELGTTNSHLLNKTQIGLNLKRNSSSGPAFTPSTSSTFRQSNLAVAGTNKKRQSGIGVASSHGRLFKVTADFFLLAGRNEEAVVWYTEAIAMLKSPQDSVWHASALEGLATVSVLDAWSAGPGLHTSANAQKEPWSDVSEKLTQASSLYYKVAPVSDEHAPSHYSLIAYLYSISVLRHASLLFSVWSAKGWGPLAFATMLHPGPRPSVPPTIHRDRNSWLELERLSVVTGISRSFVAGVLAQAHGPWLLHLGPGERVSVLEAMAGIYACLGYRRKEAYILREVLGCVMDLLVCAREENGESRASHVGPPTAGVSGVGLGIQGVDVRGEGLSPGRGTVGMRLNERTDGNDSILRLLKYVCHVLGIELEAVKLVESHGKSVSQFTVDDSTNVDNEEDAIDAPRDPYGWPELQVGVVREALAVAEALPDYPSVAQFALSSLKTLQPVLEAEEQRHLYYTSARALTTARRRGDTKFVDYWSGRPVVSIALSPLPFGRLPIEKPISALKPSMSSITPILTGATDPFLYNPRKSTTGLGQSLVVQNEPVELVITLRNPFVFDLELQSLALSTSGVPFDSKAISVVVPADSSQAVTIVGQASEVGALVIRGCIVQAPGGAPREFILPLSTDEEESRLSRRRSAIECETGRSKYSGSDSRSWEKSGKRVSGQPIQSNKRTFRYLECKVVPEQPLLRIRRTSLTHGAVMLYNGETSSIRLTLENVSALPIDLLRLSFDDSTKPPAQQALAEGELSVFETYETEYDLLHRNVFSWHGEKDFKEVAPGNKITVIVSCRGKVGCKSGTIHISYSSIYRSRAALHRPQDVFHARQLSYPVLVTVYHMLECHGMDILPFDCIDTADFPDRTGMEIIGQTRKSLLQVGDEDGWCLFSIDVRNTYGLPFDVTFQRIQEGLPEASTTSTVPPGSTARIVLPIKKFLIPEGQTSQVIPTLSDRQFVVTKSNLSSEEEKAQRELFWYREELFKCICGTWREAGGTRSGELSLRQQRMTLPMLETLRTETARVQMSLVEYNANEPGSPSQLVPHKSGKFFPPPNEFIYLRTRVTNLTPSPLILTLDFNMEPAEHLIYEGILGDIPIGRLESGASHEVETAVSFLSYGRFEIGAEARIVGASRHDSKVGKGQLRAVVKDG